MTLIIVCHCWIAYFRGSFYSGKCAFFHAGLASSQVGSVSLSSPSTQGSFVLHPDYEKGVLVRDNLVQDQLCLDCRFGNLASLART